MANNTKKVKTPAENEVHMNFGIVPRLEKDIPSSVETKVSGKRYVAWGTDNKFPEYLWDLYLRSALEQSIINGIADYVHGSGVTKVNPSIKADQINKDGETLDDILDKILIDYPIFGGFALNIIFSYEHQISEIYWLDMRKVRVDEYERKAYVCDKWAWGVKPIEYALFDRKVLEASWKTDKPINSCVFYYKGKITRGIYPVPMYNGALAAIETSTEIANFHLRNILNNMEPSAIITFKNGVPTEEEKKKIEKKMIEKFSGSSNAGKFMLNFCDDAEHGVEVARLSEDKMDEKFKSLNESTMKEIFIAFRATPALFGVNPDNNGFSKEEFLQAFELYNKTMIQPIQKEVVRCFNKIYDVDNAFSFIPFELSPSENISE